MANLATVGAVIADVAREVGLGPISVDPFASADPNVAQLIGLLKAAGNDLATEYAWPTLIFEHSFSVVSGQTTYPVPDGFRRMLNQTGWNTSMQEPVCDPVTPQLWQYLKYAEGGGMRLRVVMEVTSRALKLMEPLPAADTEISFKYLSHQWVQSASGTLSSEAHAHTDTVLFDSHLITRALKLRWREAKEFDTSSALLDYARTLAKVKSDEAGPAPVLPLKARYSDLWEPRVIYQPTVQGGGGSGEEGFDNLPLG